MRQMVPHPQRGPTLQFRCTECEWVFDVQDRRPESLSVEERRKAKAWFALHTCADYSRRVPKSHLKRFG